MGVRSIRLTQRLLKSLFDCLPMDYTSALEKMDDEESSFAELKLKMAVEEI